MKKLTIYQIAACAVMTAVLCVLGPMSIPIGAVPISLATFVLYLMVYILGTTGASVSTLVYLLLGLAGLPVFSGYSGGFAKLAGPTGGYLVGVRKCDIDALMAQYPEAFESEHYTNTVISALGLVLGTAVLYVFGTAWFVILMDVTVGYALTVCVLPFILIDLGKIVVATLIGKPVRSALEKAGLLVKFSK